jgi:short-subunit dehydrogenase
LNTLTLTARAELAKDNIWVGLVFPGFTQTNFHKNAIAYEMQSGRSTPPMDPVEPVAEKIVEACLTVPAKTYVDSVRYLDASKPG